MKQHPRNPFSLQLKEKSTEPRMVMGAYITEKLYQEISANALFHGVSRSEMVEIMVNLYLKTLGKTNPEVETIAIRRATAEWDSYKNACSRKIGFNEKVEFQKYQKELIQMLKKRGVSEEISNKIMERIR